jgi:ParB-like chromosome segregation protein Spo0J
MDTETIDTASSANAQNLIPSEPAEESGANKGVVNAEAWGEPGIVHDIPLGMFRILPGMDGRAQERSENDVMTLAESIAQEGQKTPVTYQFGEDGSIVVIMGHGRLLSMARLLQAGRSWPGGPTVRALLDESTDLNRAFISGLHENLKHKRLTPDDMVANLERLSKPPFNMDDQEIAKTLALDKSTVSGYRRYSRMCGEVRQAVLSGRLPYRAIREAPKKAADQVAWLAGLEKRAAERAERARAAKPVKAGKAPKPTKTAKPARITTSDVERGKPHAGVGAMIRSDVAKDLLGLRAYKPVRMAATVFAEIALYLKGGQNGKQLVEKVNRMFAGRLVARTELAPVRQTKPRRAATQAGLPGKPKGNKQRKEGVPKEPADTSMGSN